MNKTGWILVEKELPPIGLEVIVSYPNVAYGGMCMRCLATRVDDDWFIPAKPKGWTCSDGFRLSVKRSDNLFQKTHATHWAYNNGHKLPEITDGLCCNYDHSKKD